MHNRESLERTTLILMWKGFSYGRLGMAITFTRYLLWLTATRTRRNYRKESFTGTPLQLRMAIGPSLPSVRLCPFSNNGLGFLTKGCGGNDQMNLFLSK
jgi:hypothetical protein